MPIQTDYSFQHLGYCRAGQLLAQDYNERGWGKILGQIVQLGNYPWMEIIWVIIVFAGIIADAPFSEWFKK